MGFYAYIHMYNAVCLSGIVCSADENVMMCSCVLLHRTVCH